MDTSLWTKSARLSHRYQRTLFQLIATSQDREAEALGNVVDALFADDPLRAIRIVRARGLPDEMVSEIKVAFGLS